MNNMSYLYRCEKQYKSGPFKGQKCRQRHHFKKRVEEYARPKKCPSCDNEITLLDKWQMKKNKENICDCGEPHYPHREGETLRFIKLKTGPTEDVYKARYGDS